jgi:hypothetical protein
MGNGYAWRTGTLPGNFVFRHHQKSVALKWCHKDDEDVLEYKSGHTDGEYNTWM